MKYINVTNPVWANQEKTKINCLVTFEKLGTVLFTADPHDLPHCIEIYERCLAGDFGPVADWVDNRWDNMVYGPISESIPVSTFAPPNEIL